MTQAATRHAIGCEHAFLEIEQRVEVARIAGADADIGVGGFESCRAQRHEEFANARKRIETTLSDARARIHDARVAVAEKACHAVDATNEYVGENPWKVAGVASMIGLLAALIIFRRPSR